MDTILMGRARCWLMHFIPDLDEAAMRISTKKKNGSCLQTRVTVRANFSPLHVNRKTKSKNIEMKIWTTHFDIQRCEFIILFLWKKKSVFPRQEKKIIFSTSVNRQRATTYVEITIEKLKSHTKHTWNYNANQFYSIQFTQPGYVCTANCIFIFSLSLSLHRFVSMKTHGGFEQICICVTWKWEIEFYRLPIVI